MTFTVSSITRCSGPNQGHYHLALTSGARSANLTIGKSDLAIEPDDLTNAALWRIRSHLKENGLTTFAAIKTAIEGVSFQL